MTDFLPLDQCVERGVYQIKSRNLLVGVYNGGGGFVGVREKFGSRYLFTEVAWEAPHNGTVWPIAFIDMLPEGIEVREYLQDPEERCKLHKRPTEWRPDDPSKGRTPGWRYHKDDGSRLESEDFAGMTVYRPLFDYLDPIDQRLNEEWRRKWAQT